MKTVADLQMRAATMADAEQVLALQVRCETHEYGEPDSDIEDLLHEWGQIDLSQDAWLVFTPDDELVGYAAVFLWDDDLQYTFFADPAWPQPDLGEMLLARCEGRGKEVGGETAVAKTFIAHANEQKLAIVAQAGFSPGRYYYQMQMDVTQAPTPPVWAEGVWVRTAVPGQDDQAIHQLIETAFALPDSTPSLFADWQATMMRPDIFNPDLWLLAFHEQELVGACLSYDYATMGWVRQLGVLPQWRRQGVGAALLQQIFSVFHQRGQQKVGLSVQSKRPDAYQFYQRIGMRCARQYDEYSKPIHSHNTIQRD